MRIRFVYIPNLPGFYESDSYKPLPFRRLSAACGHGRMAVAPEIIDEADSLIHELGACRYNQGWP